MYIHLFHSVFAIQIQSDAALDIITVNDIAEHTKHNVEQDDDDHGGGENSVGTSRRLHLVLQRKHLTRENERRGE